MPCRDRQHFRPPLRAATLPAATPVILSCLLLGGCSPPERERDAPSPATDQAAAPTGGPGAPELRTFAWQCERSGYIVTDYRADPGAAWIFLPKRTLKLEAQRSASGARYGADDVVFWSKGGDATLEIGGKREDCSENRRRSIVEDAKLRGVSFWATGSEPGWTLEIGPDNVRFITNYGADTLLFPTLEYQTDAEQRTSTMVTTTTGHQLTIRLSGHEGGCSDNMSGEQFETTVELSLDGTEYRGCGAALY